MAHLYPQPRIDLSDEILPDNLGDLDSRQLLDYASENRLHREARIAFYLKAYAAGQAKLVEEMAARSMPHLRSVPPVN